MSENLIESIAPQLAAPVTREPVQTASEDDSGTTVGLCFTAPLMFADDDDD